MEYVLGQHPGAVWRRVDLQCHTPRDLGWEGSPGLSGGPPEPEAKRDTWADEFVEACLSKELSVVAITDHHDICFVAYVQRAVERNAKAKGTLWVFPGVEVTCEDNAQCLMLFDAESDPELWAKGLNMLTGVMPSSHREAKTCEIRHGNFTIEQLFQLVERDEYLKDRTILLPHFSDGRAHKHLNEDGHHPRFAKLPCAGVYIEQPFDYLDPVTIQKVRGEIPDWGTQRRAIIATGDNRRASWDRLGAHECWIKLGEKTTEALRQACLADEARIMHSTPTVPAERIIAVRVKASLCGNDPLYVTFNEGYTALIGGRGSGKSSILEYLRFGLGRTEQDLQAVTESPVREREAQLIRDTLGDDGFVEVTIDREGIRETWRREYGTREQILVTSESGATEHLTLDAAQRRFRARAFHQKELSTTMTTPATAAEQITGIAAAEALDKRRRVDQALQNAKRSLTTSLQEMAAHWQAELEREQTRAAVEDLKRRLEAQGRRLAEEGVTPENLKVLEDAPLYGRAKNYLSDVHGAIDVTRHDSAAVLSKLLAVEDDKYQDILLFSEMADLHRAVVTARETISGYLAEISTTLDALLQVRSSCQQVFAQKAAAFQQKYDAALTQQTAQKALIDDNARLGADLQLAEAAASKASATELTTRPALDRFSAARQQLSELIAERREILKDAADQVEAKSGGTLKARVKTDPKPEEYVTALCALMEGSRVAEYATRCSEWVKDALAADAAAWSAICLGILSICRSKIMSGSSLEPGKEIEDAIRRTIFKGDLPLTPNAVRKIYSLINDQTVGAVLAATPKDFIVLTYKDESGRSIAFEKASPGQQASALLELLLQQAAGTLVVDQPEDDLDNRVIMRIVNLVRTSKNTRQLIFATHNPNLVVNGDADKVIALRSGLPDDHRVGAAPPRVDVEIDGAIESIKVRESITKVMEGGKEAFDLRGRKYNF